MLVTPRDPGVRRRAKVYSSSKPARSSKISLLSTFTVNTSGSSGSNSTITQESYDRSQRPRRRKTRDHKARRNYDEVKNKSVDVFDFLVNEESKSRESLPVITDAECQHCEEQIAENTSGSSSEDDESGVDESDSGNHDDNNEQEPGLQSGLNTTHQDAEEDTDVDVAEQEPKHEPEPELELEPEPEGYYRSMSDSGISMGSSSFQPPLPILFEELSDRPSSRNEQNNQLVIVDPRWQWPISSPQPIHDGFIPPPCPQPPPAVMYDVPIYSQHTYPHPPYTPYGTPPPPIPEADIREALAVREPIGQRVKPGYFRSFSRVSTRLVLQMQDDIADLEEELAELDKEIDAANEGFDGGMSSPHDQRDRRLREEDVYRELYAKLDQYYRALEMMQKVEDISLPATTTDLSKHHAWLESRIVQTDRVRHLVGSDLRKFKVPKAPVGSTSMEINPPFQARYLAYTTLVNGVIPLITFKIFSGVLNRLILLLTTVVVGSVVQSQSRAKVGRDELTCTLVCVCIAAFAAVFL